MFPCEFCEISKNTFTLLDDCFIFTSAFISLQSSFTFQHWKKAIMTYIILLHEFLLLQETS